MKVKDIKGLGGRLFQPNHKQQLVICLVLLVSIVFSTTFSMPTAWAGSKATKAKAATPSAIKPNSSVKHAQAELIIRLVPGYTLAPAIVKQLGGTILDQISDLNIYRIGYDPNKVETDEIAEVAALPQVKYIDLNYNSQMPTGNPWFDDGGFLSEYQQQYASGLIAAAPAQLLSKGDGVTVAVLDTGVDLTHPILAPHLTTNGYDFINNNNKPLDVGGGAASGHGSAVAGLVLLAAPHSQIMPLRVLNSNGQGYLWSILKAIDYATDNGAQVINMSLGTSADTHSLRDLVTYAFQHGVTLVASAGNNNSSVAQYPCDLTPVICVAATDSQDVRASFSNYGSFVGLSAPGVSLYAPYWNGGYASWSGTSMASPLVAGGAALLKAKNPGLTVDQLISRLENSATPIYQFNAGFQGLLGSGRLNLLQALQN